MALADGRDFHRNGDQNLDGVAWVWIDTNMSKAAKSLPKP
ncbi:unnamed protein product, partial [Didymodactylos carnosus]